MSAKTYKITFYTHDGMEHSAYISIPTGKDGYTPIKGVDYFDGKNGKDGVDGKTPVKGVDYFTDAEIAEIVDEVAAQGGGDTLFVTVDYDTMTASHTPAEMAEHIANGGKVFVALDGEFAAISACNADMAAVVLIIPDVEGGTVVGVLTVDADKTVSTVEMGGGGGGIKSRAQRRLSQHHFGRYLPDRRV